MIGSRVKVLAGPYFEDDPPAGAEGIVDDFYEHDGAHDGCRGLPERADGRLWPERRGGGGLMPDLTPEWSADLGLIAGSAAHPSTQRWSTEALRDKLAIAINRRLDDVRMVGGENPPAGTDAQALLAIDDVQIAALRLAIAWREDEPCSECGGTGQVDSCIAPPGMTATCPECEGRP